MSSFTHYLEAEVLNDYIKKDTLYIGLSRTDGVRNITDNSTAPGFSSWSSSGEDGWEIDIDGIDEPGRGYVINPETSAWESESSMGLDGGYARQSIGAAGWHDVEVVLGVEGDSEVRVSSTGLEFGPAASGTTDNDANWGNITHFFISDSGSKGAGNILAYGSMPDSYQVVEGMSAKIWANTVVVRMTD